MGKLGKCCCADCCMSDAELADIASSVTIQHTIYNQTAAFSEGDCCHVAEIGDPDDYGWIYDCVVTNDVRADESITVLSTMIKTKAYSPTPAVTTCYPPEPFPQLDYSDMCGDVVTCGSTTKTYSEIEKIAGFVRWKYGRTRVSLARRLTVCSGYEAPECKFILECAIEVVYSFGAITRKSVTKNAVDNTVSECCISSSGIDVNDPPPSNIPAGSDCFWEQSEMEPSFNCNDDADEVNWGATATLWIRRFKVYDSANDIPTTVQMGDEDISECDYEACQEGNQEIEFVIQGSVIDPVVGGSIVRVPIETSCGWCYKTTAICGETECAGQVGNYCACDPSYLSRTNSSQGISFGFDTFAYVNNPYKVSNGLCHYPKVQDLDPDTPYPDCPECENHPLGYIGTGRPVDERNDCNWFDCFRCSDGWDPLISRHQPKQGTVSAYTFSSTSTLGSKVVSVPFPAVTLTLIP
jgi:hypothetical protein